MTPRSVFVSVDLAGRTIPVGTLWPHLPRNRGGNEAASFEYTPEWLAHPDRFALEPALSLGHGKFQTTAGKALFGALGDSAPDRWGRLLMERASAERARADGTAVPTLFEIDYLLRVNDVARPGAFRFSVDPTGPYLAVPSADAIPPLVELPALLRATRAVLTDDGDHTALQLLLAPGSSLGGARPKATVRDRNGQLAIAKFPAKADPHDVVRWEALALTLAAAAGLRVEQWRLVQVLRKPVLVINRFDRIGPSDSPHGQRLPFLSAMSMLNATDNETHSYLEIADAIRQHGAAAAADLRELWRRIVFTVLISNTDDHLCNHGFLYDAAQRGWRLSPVYDINPTPRSLRPRILSTAIDETNTTASVALAIEVASYFDIPHRDAHEIVTEVRQALRNWRSTARTIGLSTTEIDRVSSAFEHEDTISSPPLRVRR